jgi:predicted transcriptional regulator
VTSDETPAERLRQLRAAAGLSQRALAAKSGVSQTLIKKAMGTMRMKHGRPYSS